MSTDSTNNRPPRTCTLSLPPDVVSQVDHLAAREERPRSWMVKTLLREALAARSPSPSPEKAPE